MKARKGPRKPREKRLPWNRKSNKITWIRFPLHLAIGRAPVREGEKFH